MAGSNGPLYQAEGTRSLNYYPDEEHDRLAPILKLANSHAMEAWHVYYHTRRSRNITYRFPTTPHTGNILITFLHMYARLNCVLLVREPAHIALVGFKLISLYVPMKLVTKESLGQYPISFDGIMMIVLRRSLRRTWLPYVHLITALSRSPSGYKVCLGSDESRSNWLVSPLVFRLLDNFSHSFH